MTTTPDQSTPNGAKRPDEYDAAQVEFDAALNDWEGLRYGLIVDDPTKHSDRVRIARRKLATAWKRWEEIRAWELCEIIGVRILEES